MAGVITTTGAVEKAVLYVIVASTAFMDGAEPVVNAITPLISVPVKLIADGLVPAPVEVAILKVPELPFRCFAITSVEEVIAPVTVVLPAILVLPPM